MRDEAERRILSALREGRREAYEAVIDAHYGSVYRFLLFLTGRASLAEDLTQDVFVAAWGAVGRFHGRASIKTWLHLIAYNQAVDVQRRGARTKALTEKLNECAPELVDDPASEVILAEHVALVRQALEELDVDDRAVLVLHYIGGLTYREMAQVLDQPSGTVKWSTSRALDKLRHQLVGKVEP